jgi:hypothetical protein
MDRNKISRIAKNAWRVSLDAKEISHQLDSGKVTPGLIMLARRAADQAAQAALDLATVLAAAENEVRR